MDTHGILSVRDFFGDGNIIFYGILTFLRLRVPRAEAKTKSLILNCDYKVTELWNLSVSVSSFPPFLLQMKEAVNILGISHLFQKNKTKIVKRLT